MFPEKRGKMTKAFVCFKRDFYDNNNNDDDDDDDDYKNGKFVVYL